MLGVLSIFSPFWPDIDKSVETRIMKLHMSKPAVLVLPFFILGLTASQPVLTINSAGFGAENTVQFEANAQSSQVHGVELLSRNYPVLKGDDNAVSKTKATRVVRTMVTAYSSSVDETDDTPFITASGNYVRDGIVAANFLPFGTKVRIPELFGERIFTVEDRMRKAYSDRVDVWFASKQEALNFGYKIAKIEVL